MPRALDGGRLVGRTAVACALACAAIAAVGVAPASAAGAPPITLKTDKLHSGLDYLPFTEALSPDGKTLYSAGQGAGGLLVFRTSDLAATPKVITDAGNPLSAPDLALSPNGKTAYIADGTAVDVADVGGTGSKNDTVVGKISDPNGLIKDATAVAVSPNGKTLYVADTNPSDGLSIVGVVLASATSGKAVSSRADGQLLEPVGIQDFAMNPNGKVLYTASLLGIATAVSVSGPEVKSIRLLPEVTDAWGITVSPDGRTLYASTQGVFALEADQLADTEINTYSLTGNGLSASFARSTVLPDHEIATGLAAAPDGSKVYAGEVHERYDAKTKKIIATVSLSSFAIPPSATKVSVSGKAKVGASLSAKVAGAGGLSASYQWLADGTAIKGANKHALKLTSKLKGKTLSVEVTATAVGYHEVSLKSKATGKVS